MPECPSDMRRLKLVPGKKGEGHMSPDRSSPLEEALKDPLPGVKKQLAEEYEGLAEEKIDQAAKQALDELAEAR